MKIEAMSRLVMNVATNGTYLTGGFQWVGAGAFRPQRPGYYLTVVK